MSVKRLKESRMQNVESYSNDLHDALRRKQDNAFWQCWRSKLECKSKCSQVDCSCVDNDVIVNKFASHFKTAFSCNNSHTAESLKQKYVAARDNYCETPINDSHKFDTELVSNVVFNLNKKAVLSQR